MSGSSGRQKQGQAAASKRAREALANQDERRSRRPLQNRPAKALTGMGKPDKPSKRQPEIGLAEPQESKSPDIAALLKRYGITTVPRPVYEWGGYRYSNPEDAIAAAKRGKKA